MFDYDYHRSRSISYILDNYFEIVKLTLKIIKYLLDQC